MECINIRDVIWLPLDIISLAKGACLSVYHKFSCPRKYLWVYLDSNNLNQAPCVILHFRATNLRPRLSHVLPQLFSMCDEKLSRCGNIIRILLFVFNLTFWVCGALIIAVGAKTYVQFGPIASLDIDDKYGWSMSVPALIISIGCVIFIVAFFGCCGAITKSRCLLYTFVVLLSIIFILTLTGVILSFLNDDKVKDNVATVLNNTLDLYQEKPEIKKGWDSLQQDWPKCCGVNGPNDWLKASIPIPQSCCFDQASGSECSTEESNVRSNGCLSDIQDSISDFWTIAAAAAIAAMVVQCLGIFMACTLARGIKSSEYEYV